MAINRNCHCFVWNYFNSGFQNIGFVLETKTIVKSLVSAECLFIKAKSSHETTHKSLKWNLDNCIHENLRTAIIFAKQLFVTQFQTMLMIPGNINFLKKRQLKTLNFAVKQHLFPQFQAMFTLCIFSSKDPKDHSTSKTCLHDSWQRFVLIFFSFIFSIPSAKVIVEI